jgi:hypothetical protein
MDAVDDSSGRGDPRAIVLVEGISDQVALETLAARRGRDLGRERVRIVPIGGAQAIGRFLIRFASQESGATLAGLCDAGEVDLFRRGLALAGRGSPVTRVATEPRRTALRNVERAATLRRWSSRSPCV